MLTLDTPHKRKSFTLTLLLHIGILLLLFYFGFTYLDPPPENGIAINFGTSESGSGNIQPREPQKSLEKSVTNSQSTQISSSKSQEEVTTQTIQEAPVITKTNPKTTPTNNEVKKEIKKAPSPDKSTTDALNNLLKASKSDGISNISEGNDKTPGDKGNPEGDFNADSYYGVGKGLDGDGNYLLGGRKALNKEKYVQDCNEAGIVVVSIEVDKTGKVISATPGVKGTTNNSRCLLEPAKRAALATKFNEDNKAPSKQIGKIIYHFKLSQ